MASASSGSGKPGASAVAAGDGRSSTFSITCSRLSQYMKQKGSLGLGGIGLDLGRALDTAATNKGTTPSSRPETLRTMNLLPGIDSSNADQNQLPAAPPPTDQQLHPTASPQSQPPRGAQMTIFYGGKVIVFDNYPADKVKDLLALAGRGLNTATTPPKAQPPSCTAAAAAAPVPLPVKANPIPAGVPSHAVAATASGPPVVAPLQKPPPPQPPTVAVASDLPIARRNSLNRFLEKRKDRITSKAPYPPVNTVASSSDSGGNPLLENDKHHPTMPSPLQEKDKQPHHQSAMMMMPLKEKHHQPWLGLAPSESL